MKAWKGWNVFPPFFVDELGATFANGTKQAAPPDGQPVAGGKVRLSVLECAQTLSIRVTAYVDIGG